MNRLLPCLVLGAVAMAFGAPRSAWTFDRPVLTLSSPRAVPEANPEIRTADSIVVAGRLKSVFQSHVTMNLYHVLPSGRVTSEHRVRSAVSEEGAFRFELFAQRAGWTKGTLRGIVHVDDAPQVRQTFELTAIGDPAAEEVVETLDLTPKEKGGTLVLISPPSIPPPNHAHRYGSNMIATGRVFPTPPSGTEVELLLYHAREDGRFVAEARIAVPLLAEGKFQIDVSAPRRGWQNGRLVGVVRRKDAPEDRRHFETRIVGAPVEAEPDFGVRLSERSEVAIDLRAPVLPDVQVGTRYLVIGESPMTPHPGEREGSPVLLEIAETAGNGGKGAVHQSQFAKTLVNDAGGLEFETEIDVREDIPPGNYQLHLSPLTRNRIFPKIYHFKIVPRDAQDEGPPGKSVEKN